MTPSCPYCASEMRLQNDAKHILNNGEYHRTTTPQLFWYECYQCAARSPRMNSESKALEQALLPVPTAAPLV